MNTIKYNSTGHDVNVLQKKDWRAFARLYNGPAYAQNRYDEKLSEAYSSFCK